MEERWRCKACTFHNSAGLLCQICDSPKEPKPKAQQEGKANIEVKCPGGHSLAIFQCADFGRKYLFCDVCDVNISFDRVSFGCRVCNFDVCSKCYEADSHEAVQRAHSTHWKGRTGLHFPNTHHVLQKLLPNINIAAHAAVYLSAVGEYLAAEMLEISGNISRDHGLDRITPGCIQYAVDDDLELGTLIKSVFEEVGLAGIRPDVAASNERKAADLAAQKTIAASKVCYPSQHACLLRVRINTKDISLQASPEGMELARLSKLKVAALKQECRERKLKVSGNKDELIARLAGFVRLLIHACPDASCILWQVLLSRLSNRSPTVSTRHSGYSLLCFRWLEMRSGHPKKLAWPRLPMPMTRSGCSIPRRRC